MKKLWWLLFLFVVATAIKEGIDYFGPMAEAYRAYREKAQAEAPLKKSSAPYRDIEGSITNANYRLESAELEGDGRVRLVVVEALHFQKLTESGPFGNRRVAETRQTVLMSLLNGQWVVSELSQGVTNVRSLDEVALPGE